MRNNEEFKKLVTEKYNKQKRESVLKKKKLTALVCSFMVCTIVASVFIGNGAIDKFFVNDKDISSAGDKEDYNVNTQQPSPETEDYSQPRDEISGAVNDDKENGVLEEQPSENEPVDKPNNPNENPDNNPPEIKQTVNLMEEIKPLSINVSDKKFQDEETLSGVTDFAFELFRSSYSEGKNNLVSPASVIYALGMLANGADGYTLEQLEEKLCGTDIDRLNEFIIEYRTMFGSGEHYNTSISNSIWFDSNVSVNKSFLQTNANYYGSDAFQTVLPSDGALIDINNWAKESTNGLIDKILENFEGAPKVIIANSLYFEANWYDDMTVIGERDFTASDGQTLKAEMMAGTADYLENDYCYGFEKDYYGRYSFVALLPKDNMSVNDVLNRLDHESYSSLWNEYYEADITMPKFEVEAELDLEESLKKCGIDDIFAGGTNDFSNIGEIYGLDFYVSKITQKAKIAVDEDGTLAAAVTVVQFPPDCAPPLEIKKVDLDRPFVYMIIDRQTNIPMFIGTVESI